MRELVYYVAVSLDGFIADPDGGFGMFPVEGDHIDYLAENYGDAFPAAAHPVLGIEPDRSVFGTVLMGWSTYAVGLPYGITSPYPHLRQIVFSRTRTAADVPSDVRLADTTPQEVVAAERADSTVPGDIWLCGGGQLAASLVGEIDRLVLKVNPVLLGRGIPLFDGLAAPVDLDLTASRTFGSGVVVSDYRR